MGKIKGKTFSEVYLRNLDAEKVRFISNLQKRFKVPTATKAVVLAVENYMLKEKECERLKKQIMDINEKLGRRIAQLENEVENLKDAAAECFQVEGNLNNAKSRLKKLL